MPTLAIIDGILILVYRNDHEPPHFHVRHAGLKGRFEIGTGREMDGQLDRRTIRKVKRWAALNQDLLMQAWVASQPIGKSGTTRS